MRRVVRFRVVALVAFVLAGAVSAMAKAPIVYKVTVPESEHRWLQVEATFPDIGRAPLHFAAFGGHKNVIKLLIAKGADVNAKDMEGKTPLHFAAREGRKGAAALLISKGAKVNVEDELGRTPLALAVNAHHKDCVELLKKHGGK